jgi:DNA polymerase sigma
VHSAKMDDDETEAPISDEEEEQQQQQQHEEEEAFIPVGAPDPPAGPLPTSGGGVGGNSGSGGGVSAAAARRPPWARAAVYHEVAHLALHQEILDFEQYISPSRKEREARSGLVGRLHEVVSEMFPQAELKLFGSLATDLYLPTCVQSPFTLLVVGNGGELMRAGRLLCVGPTSMCV